ncbi:putative RNA recognition motif domain, nucleotide-binding alpha-beta plait domain superfamily [Helianthus annuus]|nr:putative RNA recognition motif domain, nucleotide-binding alpha-beta plait domain superfamily [Helianthus annuus]
MGDEGGSWNDVPTKKKTRNPDIEGNRNVSRNISKFYISNLPLGCNSWDVAEFVKVFGEVTGVYIARKNDKAGRSFGFVSFKDVADVKEMERALNGTKMGGQKLIANLARFAKENVGLHGGEKDVGRGKVKVQVKPAQKSVVNNFSILNKGKGKLFSELFANESSSTANIGSSSKPQEICIDLADETSAFKDLVGFALVGRCKDLSVLRNLGRMISEARIRGVSLSYMGGLSLFIKFDEEDSCTNFLLDHQTWKDWFVRLDPWECQPLPFERLAWVKVLGVPMHLSDNDVLNNIAEHFGKIVHGSQLEADDGNLSVSWIGLLVGEGERIHDHVTLKWRDKQFRVWVEEEAYDWVPDSVGRVIISEVDEKLPENIVSEVDPQEAGDPVNLPEGLSNSAESERLEKVNAAENVGEGNKKGVGTWSTISSSKIVGEQNDNDSGVQGNKGGGNFSRKNVFFFKSADQLKRPNKRNLVLRPRSKTQSSQGRASPISSERPKKRARDNGEFNLDLNKEPFSQVQGEFHTEKADIGQNDSIGTSRLPRLATDSKENEPENLGEDSVPSEDEEEEVADSFKSLQAEEVEATIRIGNMVGAELENQSELVKEAIRIEGKYAVYQ